MDMTCHRGLQHWTSHNDITQLCRAVWHSRRWCIELGHRYKLRPRTHDFTLTCKSSFHDNCYVITRLWFRDASAYWWWTESVEKWMTSLATMWKILDQCTRRWIVDTTNDVDVDEMNLQLDSKCISNSGVFRGGTSDGGTAHPGSDRELLNNVCTVSVSFFRDWIIKSLHVPRLCLLKMASKCSQTYHFLQNKYFFLHRSPVPSTTPNTPRRLRRFAPSLLKS